ncbi:MAG: hypothetical protein ACNA7O_16850 [Rhodobacterales bacterium]
MVNDASETKSSFYFPPNSTLVSRNLYLFLLDYFNVIDLFFFTLNLAHNADKVVLTTSKALIVFEKDEQKRQEYQSTIDNPDRTVKKLNGFAALNSRNLTVTTVDAFLWFISATIQSAMKKRPEMVKSGETIKIEDVFEFKNKRELIDYLIDRKVNSLSYGGMSKIEKFILDSMGVTMFTNDDDRALMQTFVEVRNIHVHNRGMVNRIFLGRVAQQSRFDFSEGKRAQLNFDELVALTRVCVQTTLELDAKICEKFGIKRKRYSTWKNSGNSPKNSVKS